MNPGSSMLELLSFFFFSLLESDAGGTGGAGLSPPAAWAGASRGTAVSVATNIASVKSLIANFIRRSRFPVGQSYTEPRLLEHPSPRDIPGYRALFATEQARLARDIGGNMTNLSTR